MQFYGKSCMLQSSESLPFRGLASHFDETALNGNCLGKETPCLCKPFMSLRKPFDHVTNRKCCETFTERHFKNPAYLCISNN